MNIPFVKWGKTPEGSWTLLRLLTAIVMLVVAINMPSTNYVPLYVVAVVGIIGAIIMVKSVLLFLRQPEFKVMADGKSTANFYRGSIYKFVRHPFYSGFWLVMLSLTLCHLNIHIITLFCLYTLLTRIAAIEEERRLLTRFPCHYSLYSQKTPQFIPWKLIAFTKALFTR